MEPANGSQLRDSVELAWVSPCGLDETSSEWDAEKTHDWLLQKLIPKVAGPAEKLRQAFGENHARVRSAKTEPEERLAPIAPTVGTLTVWTAAVQRHFNATPHDGVPKHLLHSTYDGMAHLVRLTNTEGLRHGYLAGKLGASEANTGLLEWVQAARRRDLAKDKVRGWDLDLIFRCANMLMQEHPPAESAELGKLVELWRPLHEHYRLDWLRLRHSRRPEEE